MFNFLKRNKEEQMVNLYIEEGVDKKQVTRILRLAKEECNLLLDRVALDSDGIIVTGSEKHYIMNRKVVMKGSEKTLCTVRIWRGIQ